HGIGGSKDDNNQWKSWFGSVPTMITPEIDRYLLISGGVALVISINVIPWLMSKKKKRKEEDVGPLVSNQNLSTLHDIAKSKSDPEIVLFDYGKYGFSVVPLCEKWEDWISYEKGEKGLVATVNRPDLDYNDFGNEFHFIDLSNGKTVSIPIGKLAKHLDVNSSFHKGMVLRLMHKDP
ncbi:MAG: hypothetical protein ACUZ9M_07110, partial [Candidatus Scalindua sp.]